MVGKGVIKHIRSIYPMANIAAIDYDPGASEVNQLNRIKLMLATAGKNAARKAAAEDDPYYGTVNCTGSSIGTGSGSGSESSAKAKKASKKKRNLFPFNR